MSALCKTRGFTKSDNRFIYALGVHRNQLCNTVSLQITYHPDVSEDDRDEFSERLESLLNATYPNSQLVRS